VKEVESAELKISPESVCFVIIEAREFDVKDGVSDLHTGSNPTDDKMTAVLEDHKDDPVTQELTSFIGVMSVEKKINLVALVWLGRGDFSADD